MQHHRAVIGSPGGTYPITCAGQTATNYALTYQPGTLTVGQGGQSITFGALANRAYGDPALTLTATGGTVRAGTVTYAVPLGMVTSARWSSVARHCPSSASAPAP